MGGPWAQWVMGYQIKGMVSLYLPDTFPAILDFALIFKLWSVHIYIYIIAKMPLIWYPMTHWAQGPPTLFCVKS